MKPSRNSVCAKALAALAVVCMAAFSVKADLIYWMVNNPTESYSTPGTPTSIPYAYATSSADGNTLYAYDQTGKTEADALFAEGGSTGAAYFGSFNSDSVQSFLVELWNESDEKVGWQTYSAASVADSIWKGNSPGGSGAVALVVSQVVPEPSSGLMLLLGGALLALRRRRLA